MYSLLNSHSVNNTRYEPIDPPFEPKVYGRCLPPAVDINRLILITMLIIILIIKIIRLSILLITATTHATKTS